MASDAEMISDGLDSVIRGINLQANTALHPLPKFIHPLTPYFPR